MVTRVNLLLKRMMKQSRDCVLIISLFKKIFVKHFKVFHKFEDTAYSVDLFITNLLMGMCMYILM